MGNRVGVCGMGLSAWGLVMTALASVDAAAQVAGRRPPAAVQEMSLEDLLNVEVTSVSRKPQSLADSAGAVFVLTRADIRRLGVTTIPDALRTVPGLDVARIDASKWAVSARGDSGRFANRLLVLVDGRSVYTPLFGGVYWESLDIPLDDVAHIEVIRGPGGTMWGANAMNGVINIITTSARDTDRVSAHVTVDDRQQATGTVSLSTPVGSGAALRLYGRTTRRELAWGTAPRDDIRTTSVGGRLDKGTQQNGLTLSGDLQAGEARQTLTRNLAVPALGDLSTDRVEMFSGVVGVTARRGLSPTSQVVARASFEHMHRFDFFLGMERRTAEAELTHRVAVGRSHDLVWGGLFRDTVDDIDDSVLIRMQRPHEHFRIVNAFVQDEMLLARARTRVTVGTKVEHNSYTGFELQPSARVLWSPTTHQSVWAAVSKAVRNPSRIEASIGRMILAYLPPDADRPLPLLVTFGAGAGLESETLVATEVGYRRRLGDFATVDLTAFDNRYSDTLSARPSVPSVELTADGPLLVQEFGGANAGTARRRGVETSVEVRPTSRVRVIGAASVYAAREDTGLPVSPGDDAKARASVRGQVEGPYRLEIDPVIRHVGAMTGLQVPSYTTFDLHVGRAVHKRLTLGITAQNLVGGPRLETRPTVLNTAAAPVGRTVTVATSWHF